MPALRRIATIHVGAGNTALARARARALAAIRSGKYQGEHFGFESPSALSRAITPMRWQLLAKLQQAGPLAIRGLARELNRDFRRVRDDVARLLRLGLVEKTADGKVWVPFKEIRVSFVLRSG